MANRDRPAGRTGMGRMGAALVTRLFLAAPVGGNPKVARSGRLTLAVFGPQEVFSGVEPVLSELGRRVTYVGEADVTVMQRYR